MIDLFVIAETFSEQMARPIWEDPSRLLSPGMILIFTAVLAAWKAYQTASSWADGILAAIKVLIERLGTLAEQKEKELKSKEDK